MIAPTPGETALRFYVGLTLGVLIRVNIAARGVASRIASAYPVLIGSIVLVYGLRLWRALDANHIAAIDNVTCMPVAARERPAGMRFFFSLRHSSVVVVATVGAAFAAGQFKAKPLLIQDVLGPFGATILSVFLLVAAALNVLVFAGVWRALRRRRTDCDDRSASNTGTPAGRPFSRSLDGVMRRVSWIWLMSPPGLVFCLGFDTATESGLPGQAIMISDTPPGCPARLRRMRR